MIYSIGIGMALTAVALGVVISQVYDWTSEKVRKWRSRS